MEMSCIKYAYKNKNIFSPCPTFTHSDIYALKVSGLTYKSCAKWKMLGGIYCAVYGEVNVSVSVCVEIKGDYNEK
jgi:uncharacterized protein with FMN-binding domain